MKRRIAYLLALLVFFSHVVLARSDATPSTRLYELHGGDLELMNKNLLSDTNSYSKTAIKMRNPVYLLQHKGKWLLWDTGLPDYIAESPDGIIYDDWRLILRTTITQQLKALDLTPDDIHYVALSHANMDHTGNTNLFKKATLIIQEDEYNALIDDKLAKKNHLAPDLLSWFLTGGGKDQVRKLKRDTDLFGDGKVLAIYLPGHTAGHMALQINLENSGSVILAGDLWHTSENRRKKQLADFNVSRSDIIASINRMEGILKNSGARLIIQHDPDMSFRLPTFPKYLD